jgi:hypothetical protein
VLTALLGASRVCHQAGFELAAGSMILHAQLKRSGIALVKCRGFPCTLHGYAPRDGTAEAAETEARSKRGRKMGDDLITELITAIVAARADGDGVLTIAAVPGCLAAAKLRVERVEDASDPNPRPPYDDDDAEGEKQ